MAAIVEERQLEAPKLSMTEFAEDNGVAYNDACGCNMNNTMQAALGLAPQTTAAQTAIRHRDILRGWFTPHGGQTLAAIRDDILTFVPQAEIVAYFHYSQPGDWADMLPALRANLGINPCGLQFGQAHNLIGNEGGVFEHFATGGGYRRDADGNEWVLLFNGDDVAALGAHGQAYYPPRWIPMSNLIAADVQGLLIIKRKGGSAPMPPTLLTIDQVAAYFVQHDTEHWVRKDNPALEVHLGMLDGYRRYPSLGSLFGFTEFGLPRTNELQAFAPKSRTPLPNVAFQVYERGVLAWDPNHLLDHVPGITGPWYRTHLELALPYLLPGSENQAALLSALHTLQSAETQVQTALATLAQQIASAA